MITHLNANIFTADKGIKDKDVVIAHSCNCMGVWGSGFAAQLRERFPDLYKQHFTLKPYVVGTYQVLTNEQVAILNLFTSFMYGFKKDAPTSILMNTKIALQSWSKTIDKPVIVLSPAINSGLFNVPWEHTTKIIEEIEKANPNIRWHAFIQK